MVHVSYIKLFHVLLLMLLRTDCDEQPESQIQSLLVSFTFLIITHLR